jgi:hypothetical protein
MDVTSGSESLERRVRAGNGASRQCLHIAWSVISVCHGDSPIQIIVTRQSIPSPCSADSWCEHEDALPGVELS